MNPSNERKDILIVNPKRELTDSLRRFLCKRGHNVDAASPIFKLVRYSVDPPLTKATQNELQATKELEKKIQAAYQSEHNRSPRNFASNTKDSRNCLYVLAWCFLVHYQLRFLILDNKPDNLKKMVDELGIPTGDVDNVLVMPNPPGIYFLNFKNFTNKVNNVDVHSEKWGEAVREIFKSNGRFAYDGIVLDIFLDQKDMYDGIDILQALKNDDEQFYHRSEDGLDNIPIIMLTGLGDEWHIIESINKKADWYIPKYKYGDQQLIESIKEIPVTFYRLYLRRRQLQKWFLKIVKHICKINRIMEGKGQDNKLKNSLDQIQKEMQDFERRDVPSFLSTFFKSLDQIVKNCQSILAGLKSEDWVEVKSAGESILGQLDQISQFNDVYFFKSNEELKKYKEKWLGRDRASVPFIDKGQKKLINWEDLGYYYC